MIGMKISWFALEVLLLVLFAWFGSSTALALAVLLVVLPLGGLAVNGRICQKLHIRLEGTGNLRKNEQGTVWVILENRTVFPAFWVRCKILAQNQLNGETMTLQVTGMIPGKGVCNLPVELGSSCCGRIRLSLKQVAVYDCFALIGIRRKADSAVHITVQPDTFEMELSLLSNFYHADESDTSSPQRPGDDLTETYQIREYVPGDSPRQIHWKLSGKFDRLIVRDPAMPIIRNVLVFWERTGESGDKRRIDAQAEAVVSICRSLADQAIPFTVGWNDTDRNLCVIHEIQDMDTLVGIIPRLMRAQGKRDGVSGADLLLRTRPDALCTHMLYLAEQPQPEAEMLRQFGNVSMLLCGETVPADSIYFDSENYTQQLSHILM